MLPKAMTSRHLSPGRRFLLAAVAGGIFAGVFSTLVQVALWLALTDAFPEILWRDARLTAALLLGAGVLDAEGVAGWPVMAVATLIHFALSILYAAVLWTVARPFAPLGQIAAGALLGVGLYVLNLHGFTLLFPWFEPARGGITLAAHVAFGMSAVAACRWAEERMGPPLRRPRSQ